MDYKESYFKLTESRMLAALRKDPIKGKAPMIKMVQFGDDAAIPYYLGEGGEYWRNGLPLTSVLQTSANLGNSRVRIF